MFFSLIAFASRYADVPVIKAVMDGSEYQGRSSFSGHDTIVLKKWGCKILTVRLKGFIFFFTAERLRLDLLRLIQSPSRTGTRKIEYLILDFRTTHLLSYLFIHQPSDLKLQLVLSREKG